MELMQRIRNTTPMTQLLLLGTACVVGWFGWRLVEYLNSSLSSGRVGDAWRVVKHALRVGEREIALRKDKEAEKLLKWTMWKEEDSTIVQELDTYIEGLNNDEAQRRIAQEMLETASNLSTVKNSKISA